ncbi:hypothetical protein [Pseudoxanthomonas sp. CF125]|uniref:hypothetical protein n=1 Tax=Pseudoxanthomonas sp. CF125 TaxID=1855303 RepID=UPI0008890C5D|nr:hypothetical protein [Pseudoxanthomonas sp. CF125]SDQ86842.1 hypothetical protein SAMN05216569_2365 [Pseudoxanthomonas sp. CF125]
MDSNLEEVKKLLVKLAAIANQIDARSVEAVRRIEGSAAALDQGRQRFNASAEQFVGQAVRSIGEQAHDVIVQGTGQAVRQFNAQLQQSAASAKSSAETMREQHNLLARAQSMLVWKGLIALIIGSLLAAGGSSYLVWKNMRELKRAEFGADILHATQSGSLTRCGKDNALCAKVGKSPKRAGMQGEYLLLED